MEATTFSQLVNPFVAVDAVNAADQLGQALLALCQGKEGHEVSQAHALAIQCCLSTCFVCMQCSYRFSHLCGVRQGTLWLTCLKLKQLPQC